MGKWMEMIQFEGSNLQPLNFSDSKNRPVSFSGPCVFFCRRVDMKKQQKIKAPRKTQKALLRSYHFGPENRLPPHLSGGLCIACSFFVLWAWAGECVSRRVRQEKRRWRCSEKRRGEGNRGRVANFQESYNKPLEHTPCWNNLRKLFGCPKKHRRVFVDEDLESPRNGVFFCGCSYVMNVIKASMHELEKFGVKSSSQCWLNRCSVHFW